MARSSTIATLTVENKLADPSLWHQPGGEVHLGCEHCVERDLCGGLRVGASIHNCMTLCCGQPDACKRYVCPMNPSRYAELVNEVGGFELRPYKGRGAHVVALPTYAPCILDAGNLAGPLHIPTVALSLYSVIDHRTGLAKYSSREEMLTAFKLYPHARVILAATGEDKRVENFWHVLRPKKTAESLKLLRPALVATPNFSMHADTVRHDNLLSMKRIAACFEDFASAGLPVALHPNGRTDTDFARWTSYLNESPGISTLAYEMGTMGRSASRRSWHAEQLIVLAKNVRRPLTLVVRGGTKHLSDLARVYHHVVLLDTTAHMKAKKRQAASIVNGTIAWMPSPTKRGESIDGILLRNIRATQRGIHRLLPRQVIPLDASVHSPTSPIEKDQSTSSRLWTNAHSAGELFT